jgi:hypothetical protein
VPRAELECPLCGQTSTIHTTPGNVYVRCPNCGWYRVTCLAHSYFFEGSVYRQLDGVSRQKLIDYVKASAASNSGAPVELSIEVVRELLWLGESA